jgi:hypothetical protein
MITWCMLNSNLRLHFDAASRVFHISHTTTIVNDAASYKYQLSSTKVTPSHMAAEPRACFHCSDPKALLLDHVKVCFLALYDSQYAHSSTLLPYYLWSGKWRDGMLKISTFLWNWVLFWSPAWVLENSLHRRPNYAFVAMVTREKLPVCLVDIRLKPIVSY